MTLYTIDYKKDESGKVYHKTCSPEYLTALLNELLEEYGMCCILGVTTT